MNICNNLHTMFLWSTAPAMKLDKEIKHSSLV